MKKAITPILVFVFLQIVGCSDIVTEHYATRSDAEASELFGRGWLPIFIPMSARDITTSNNLDINTSEGEFYYDTKETNEFLKHLKSYSGQKPLLPRWQPYIAEQKNKGYTVFEYSNGYSVWVFSVNSKNCHVNYVMWLL